MGTKSTTTTTGYKYGFGLHMGFGRGPVDELVEIRVGDLTAWTGSVTGNARFPIHKPDLFGGDDSEGGVDGTMRIMMGAADQAADAGLRSMVGRAVSAFRGQVTGFFDGFVISNNKYPKAWSVRARRARKGWHGDACWYPEKAVIDLTKTVDATDNTPGDTPGALRTIKAMNPAHMLVELNTNPDWGRGLDRSRLDLDSYAAAADTLSAEGFGLCYRWTRGRNERVGAVIQSVLDHIGAAQYVDRRTGLLTLTLIRDDYDAETLPLFDPESGLLGIDEDTASTADMAANEVIVTYIDPVTGQEGSVRERNVGAIRAAGETITTEAAYPMLPTAELAHRVAARDVRAGTSGLRRLKVRLDRRGYALEPGGVFRIAHPGYGLTAMVLRIGEIDYGTLTGGTVTATCLQDVFGLPATGWGDVQTGIDARGDRVPQATGAARIDEMTYRDMLRIAEARAALTGGAVSGLASGLMTLADRPQALALGYGNWLRAGTAGDFTRRGAGDWTPNATLAAPLSRLGERALIAAVSSDWSDLFAAGGPGLIGDEIVRIDAVAEDAAAGLRVVTVDLAGASAAALAALVDGFAYTPADDTGTGVRVVTLHALQDDGGTENGGVDWAFPAAASTVSVGGADGDAAGVGVEAVSALESVNNPPWLTATARNPGAAAGTAAVLFEDTVAGTGDEDGNTGQGFATLVIVVEGVAGDGEALTLDGTPLPLADGGAATTANGYGCRVVAPVAVATLARGCIDTLPARHAAGDRVWAYEDYHAYADDTYAAGIAVQAKPATKTNFGTLPLDAAPVATRTLRGTRPRRPYLPGRIALNGVAYPEIAPQADTYTLTYAHRDRPAQADLIVDCTEDDIGPEDGTVYRYSLTDLETGQVAYTSHALWSGTTMRLAYATDSGTGADHRLTVWAERAEATATNGTNEDGTVTHESWARYTCLLPKGAVVSGGDSVTLAEGLSFYAMTDAVKASLRSTYPSGGGSQTRIADVLLRAAGLREGDLLSAEAGDPAIVRITANAPVLNGVILSGAALSGAWTVLDPAAGPSAVTPPVAGGAWAVHGHRLLGIVMQGDIGAATVASVALLFEGDMTGLPGRLRATFHPRDRSGAPRLDGDNLPADWAAWSVTGQGIAVDFGAAVTATADGMTGTVFAASALSAEAPAGLAPAVGDAGRGDYAPTLDRCAVVVFDLIDGG